jgi:hypothetical protein
MLAAYPAPLHLPFPCSWCVHRLLSLARSGRISTYASRSVNTRSPPCAVPEKVDLQPIEHGWVSVFDAHSKNMDGQSRTATGAAIRFGRCATPHKTPALLLRVQGASHPPCANSPLRDGAPAPVALSAFSATGASVPAKPALGGCQLGALGMCSWKLLTRMSRGPSWRIRVRGVLLRCGVLSLCIIADDTLCETREPGRGLPATSSSHTVPLAHCFFTENKRHACSEETIALYRWTIICYESLYID